VKRAIFLLAMATVLMGNRGCGGTGNSVPLNPQCHLYYYPLCSEVPSTYPCLCLSGPEGLTVEEERALIVPDFSE